jgi:hypothetical protein
VVLETPSGRPTTVKKSRYLRVHGKKHLLPQAGGGLGGTATIVVMQAVQCDAIIQPFQSEQHRVMNEGVIAFTHASKDA